MSARRVVPTRTTPRLVLRGFTASDRAPFAAMNADPVVMEHYPSVLTHEQSDAYVDRVESTWAQRGLGLWAVEQRSTSAFVGYVGLWPVPREVQGAIGSGSAVEVGWRLAASAWGQGFATEGAREAVRFGFDEVGLAEIVSFTSVGNERSRAVMRRLGMRHDLAGDFDHPSLPVGHRLRRHVLYRLPAPQAGAVAGSAAHATPTSRNPTRS